MGHDTFSRYHSDVSFRIVQGVERIVLLGYLFLIQMPWPFPERRPWEWHYYWSGGWWGLILMILAMVFFWGIVIGGVILVVRTILSLGREKNSSQALEILKQRYARGEIEKDEFEQKKKDIMS